MIYKLQFILKFKYTYDKISELDIFVSKKVFQFKQF